MNWTDRKARRARKSGRGRLAYPAFETFEDRTLLSNYIVSKTADDGTAGTLRAVIADLNATGEATNTITFDLGTGLHTIQLTNPSPLDTITKQVSIEGYTQDGSSQNTAGVGTNAVITAQLDLNGHAGITFGTGSDGSSIAGLAIYGGSGSAITVQANNVTVAGNFLGIQADGATVSGNDTGITVTSGTGITIGGALTTADTTLTPLGGRNLISGNTTGITVTANGASIVGNTFGTDAAGLVPKANTTGVAVSGSSTTIGGILPNAANVFGSNTTAVSLTGGSNTVRGNTFGTSIAASSLGNTTGVAISSASNLISGNLFGKNETGVSISGVLATGNQLFGNTVGIGASGANVGNTTGFSVSSSNNSIGGTAPGQGNTLGFNTTGISISGASTTGNQVLGNFIGTDATLAAHFGNGTGIAITDASNNVIGGSVTNAPNAIAFNTASGIVVTGASATGNLITQNSVFQNTGPGISLQSGGNGNQAARVIKSVNTLGGTTNVTVVTTGLSPNSVIEVFSSGPADPSTGNQARTYVGNHTVTGAEISAGTVTFSTTTSIPIGLYATATLTPSTNNTSPFANSVISASPFLVTTTADNGDDANPTVGSLRAAIVNANNIGGQDTITFAIPTSDPNYNSLTGVWTISLSTKALPSITESVIIDATIGNFYQGSPAIVINGGNLSGDGLDLANGSAGSRIRGLAIQSFKTGAGIHIESSGNTIQSNYLGTNAEGLGGGPGNLVGVQIDGTAANNTVGGLTTVGNLISGNSSAGVSISGSAAGNNVIQGNLIGTTASGSVALANGAGIVIVDSSNNQIGGATTTRGNVIAFNNGIGVSISTTLSGTADGNIISLNSIFQNQQGIILSGTGTAPNGGIATPVIGSASPAGSKTTVQLNTTGYAVGTVLEFYASVSGDPIYQNTTQPPVPPEVPQGQAHQYLGSYILTAGDLNKTISISLSATVPLGQYLTATATSATGSSSLAAPVPLSNPFVVTTLADNGDNVSPTPGSLRAAIINTNKTPGTDTITFALPAGSPTYIFLVTSSPLPTITDSVIIDGTTQAGFNGAPIVIIDGQNTISTAFNLGAGSDGSIIRGFQITGFTSDAIVVAASNATIGGGVGGQGNIIFGNSGDAIHVTAGAGNTFSQNLIYSNAGSIVLASNTNGNQVAPTITSVTSVPNLTTIDFDFTAAAAGNYTFEFFASGTGGEGPAKVFLGTKTLSLAAGANHRTVTLNLATPLVNQTVTATATSNATQNTSALAASQPLGNAFQVSNTNDSGTGSLRQAIINADATGSLVPITIDFTISTSTISLVTPLPAVTVPLVLAPSTVITLSGLSLPAGSSGFDLEAGSGGSVIRNFTISGFGGSAILVNSSNNTISGLTIDYVSGQSGVAVGSGLLGNVITQNDFTGPDNNPANDIPGAPTLNVTTITASAIVDTSLIVKVDAPQTSLIDIYLISGNSRIFLGEGLPDSNGDVTVPKGIAKQNDVILVTATDPSVGTSAYSLPVTIAAANVVTTIADGGVGSLRQVIAQTGPNGTIFFQIGETGSTQTITLTTTQLAALAPGVILDGWSQGEVPEVDKNGNPVLDGNGIQVYGIPVLDGLGNPVLDTNGNPTYTKYTGTPLINIVDGKGIKDGIILGGNNTVQGVAIYGFDEAGITDYYIDDSRNTIITNNNIIIGNYIGFDSAKTITGLGNQIGILIKGSLTTIGGTEIADQNQISANIGSGIELDGDQNTVLNNLIGSSVFRSTSANQTGNGADGILITSSENTIGGYLLAGDGATILAFLPNTIDGNKSFGINIMGGTKNSVLGNTIGQTQALDAANGWVFDQLTFGNGRSGIHIQNSTGNLIGQESQAPYYVQDGEAFYVTNDGGKTYVFADYTIPTDTTLYQENGQGQFVEIKTASVKLDGTLIYAKTGDDYIPILITPPAGTKFYVVRSDTYVPVSSTSVSNRIFGNIDNGIAIEFDTPRAGSISIDNKIANNQIAFNGGNGISLKLNPLTQAGTPGTVDGQITIDSNLIGTNPWGDSTAEAYLIPTDSQSLFTPVTVGIGNGKDGIQVQNLKSSIESNVISGNGISGIDLIGGSSGASISNNKIGTNRDATSALDPTGSYRLGNVLDGILLDGTSNVTIGGSTALGNVISGNLGRGIEIRGGGQNTIQGNFIGTNVNGTSVTDQVTTTQTLGNLGDGIFLLDVHVNDIFKDNVISGNRGFGLHAKSSSGLTQIVGNYIGTSANGLAHIDGNQNSFGNNSDGIFFDDVHDSTIGGTTIEERNVISNNSANGIDLLDSWNILVRGNLIGTDSSGVKAGFGNAGNGVFINQSGTVKSGDNTIGGSTTAEQNIISGNLSSGIVISGESSDGHGNRVSGNLIGLGSDGLALSNNVSGIVINASSNNIVGGTTDGERNTISGNRLYGVELASGASGNSIQGNFIGVDTTGQGPRGNTSDGIFLIDSPNNSIGGTASGAKNVISGNFANGVRIFGSGSTGNVIQGNLIGLGDDGTTRIANLGNGVLFDNVGAGNIIGGQVANNAEGLIGPRNIISGNIQSGVLILSSDRTLGGGATVIGNYIGTNESGTQAVGNGANGILIFGSSNNSIGGGVGLGNVISGNIQSGVFLYTAAKNAEANGNLIQGNLIGTNWEGTHAIPNNADGIQIVNGNYNRIVSNVLSGNLSDGINVTAISDSTTDQLTATGNQIWNNTIGLAADGISALIGGVQQNGVVIQDASGNIIGSVNGGDLLPNTNVQNAGKASNVITGNVQNGILIAGQSQYNTIEGNYIGVDRYAHAVVDNARNGVGVFINNTAGLAGANSIGGTTFGSGNIISGSRGVGIQIFGPSSGVDAQTKVLGNVIGLSLVSANGQNPNLWTADSNVHGVAIQNSAGNIIGGTSILAQNIISGNSDSGVLITGAGSTRNLVEGNLIGVAPNGTASIVYGDGSFVQQNGVQIANNGAINNFIGGGSYSASGRNVLSGNHIGVAVNNVGISDPNQRNVIQGNLAGVTPDGNGAAGNSEYGIFVNNSPYTLVLNNLASANRIGGIGIVGTGPTFVTVNANIVGPGIGGGIPGVQTNGVVIIGASNNIIGGPDAGNLIRGNTSVGVYISKQDFNGVNYATPVSNLVQYNTITNNKVYGILFYNAPTNTAPPFTGTSRGRVARRRRPGSNANVVTGNGVNFLNYVSRLNRNSGLKATPKAQAHPSTHAKPLKVIMPKHK